MPVVGRSLSPKKIPVQARPEGGYMKVDTPDPNDAMSTFQRGQGPNLNPLGSGIGLQLRGVAQHRQADYEKSTEARALGGPAVINTVAPDARWEGFKQALYERGTKHIGTEGSQGMVDPSGLLSNQKAGFFDTQDPNAERRKVALEYLRAQDYNIFGKAYA